MGILKTFKYSNLGLASQIQKALGKHQHLRGLAQPPVFLGCPPGT